MPISLTGDLKHATIELIYVVYVERGIRIISIKVKTLKMVIKNRKLVRKVF